MKNNKWRKLAINYKNLSLPSLLNKGIIKIKNTFSFQPKLQSSKLSSLRDKSLYE